ncbi:hypothetical protein RB195_004054 [Necator americanus]|uniref:Uncharacterized protein n=1 Tax=Necator americanus TaxID=51031 RepID=A0ABR1BI69_NECAM
MSSYSVYERADFFDPTYLNQIPISPYDFYQTPQHQNDPIANGEPVIPYGWRSDWSRPTEWLPPTQMLHAVPQEQRTYGYVEMPKPTDMKSMLLKPLTREPPANKPFRCQESDRSHVRCAIDDSLKAPH